MRTTVDKPTLKRFTAIVRITYTTEQLEFAGLMNVPTSTISKTIEVKASDMAEARERIIKKAQREWPEAGLVIRCITMHGKESNDE